MACLLSCSPEIKVAFISSIHGWTFTILVRCRSLPLSIDATTTLKGNGPSSTYLMMHVNGGFQATRAFRSQVAQPKGGPSLFRRPGRFRQPSPRAAQGFKGKDLPEMSLSLKFQYCFAYTRTDNGFQAPQALQAAQPKGGPEP